MIEYHNRRGERPPTIFFNLTETTIIRNILEADSLEQTIDNVWKLIESTPIIQKELRRSNLTTEQIHRAYAYAALNTESLIKYYTASVQFKKKWGLRDIRRIDNVFHRDD